MTRGPEDDAPFAGLAAGDRTAAATFVGRSAAAVTGAGYQVVRDRAMAEDVAQEAFLKRGRRRRPTIPGGEALGLGFCPSAATRPSTWCAYGGPLPSARMRDALEVEAQLSCDQSTAGGRPIGQPEDREWGRTLGLPRRS